MEFHVLGPIELLVAGEQQDLGSARERCVLAILLLSRGRAVSADTLIEGLWGERPPPKARESLYSYVARLRSRLRQATGADARITFRFGGYLLEVDSETVDVNRFRLLRAQGRAIADSGDDEQAARLLGEALDLWHGEPLAGLSGDWALQARRRLEYERLATIQERAAVELRLGRHAQLVDQLSDLVAQHPLEEPLAGILMTALYGSGRQAEALDVYRRTHRRLVDELGAEPGPELQQLHLRILRRDPALVPARAVARPPLVRPNNLPRDIPDFTGREEEMRQLLAASPAGAGAATTNLIPVIDGMAGVGKTAFAVHAAHRLRDRFPDAQLYLRLHAHDATQQPLDPSACVGALLRAIGVPAADMPRTLEERAALWRARLAHKRVLILLDDAAGQHQVRPLLPGTPGSLVLVTSRRRLVGLDGVRPLTMDVLPAPDAVELFTRIADRERAASAEAVAEVVRLCGHLPLAIQLVASRLRHRPAWSVQDLVNRLGGTHDRLAEIRAEDRTIAAAFELSYRGLGGSEQRMFRRLGLHPGSDFTLAAAVAMDGSALAETERIVDELLDQHLLEERVRGRYRFHDLVRRYARHVAEREEGTAERRAAEQRILDFYLHSADRADRMLYPHRRRIRSAESESLPASTSTSTSVRLDTAADAQGWMEAERENLLAAAQYAFDHDWPMHAAWIPHILAQFLETWGYWTDAARAHEHALTAWQAMGDSAGAAQSMIELSDVHWRAGRFKEALLLADQALQARRQLEDQQGVAETLSHMGRIHRHSGHLAEARQCCEEALAIYQGLGDQRGQAATLVIAGITHSYLGAYGTAADHFRRALALFRKIGDRYGEKRALNNAGEVALRFGHYDVALSNYERALEIDEATGGRQDEVILRTNLANLYRDTGRHDEALQSYRDALGILRDIGDRSGEIDALINIGRCFSQSGRDPEALVHHKQAATIAADIGDLFQKAQALRYMASVYGRMGLLRKALRDFQRALTMFEELDALDEQAHALSGIGDTLERMGDEVRARVSWQRALGLYDRLGVPEAQEIRAKLETQRPGPEAGPGATGA